MKKIIASLAAVVFAAGLVGAQDFAGITEIYNNGAASLTAGDKAGALASFEEALEKATALGEEGKDIVENCKNIIPNINLSIAKDFIKASDYDSAIQKLVAVLEIAKNFGAEDILAEAEGLIPQVKMQKGNGLLKENPAAAAEIYKEIIDADATNGMAALRLGQALGASGDSDGAVAAFEQAAANGQEKMALKQLSTLFLKKASAALKSKSFGDAVTAALKANEYLANPQALQIAGQASQLAGKNNDAIKYFTQYLEAAPDAKNAGQIAYTVGALYQGAKNIEKAKEFYQKAASDPKYGAEAQKLLNSLK
ncbi:MAG: hypothetical protein MJY69_05965 [Bacteroidales bacterium]|nr:hypothetical protein [Bacteroidales bacterium]